MEYRRNPSGRLDRYGALLRLITDPQAIAALEQLRETRYPVACKFVVAANVILADIETVRPPSCTSAGEINEPSSRPWARGALLYHGRATPERSRKMLSREGERGF
jgi:hypothetical protein